MGDRTVVPLLYGAGMDRATGMFSVDGKAGRDLRNLYLYRDKAQVRHGHARVNDLVVSGVTVKDVLLVQAMSAEQIGLVVGFGNDGKLYLFRVAGDGGGLSEIGTWPNLVGADFTLSAGAHTPPRVLAAEQYSKIFVAHDEANRILRAPTVYYNPFGAPALNTLTADLDGDGSAAPVLFRGVSPYLTYLVGWGFGTETDPDHPEVVRVSHPDDPTLLDPDDYFEAGTGGSPVLTCLQAGTVDNSCLLVLKPSEIHQIFGYDKNTFGVRQIESGHGVVASRLAYSLGGMVYFWDPEGPRRSSGGPSEDLAWPLDLDAPSPADLVAAGALADGFCCYLPSRRCLLFVFGPRVYVLNLWDAGALKWSYGELGFAAQSGGVLYQGLDAPSAPPTAAASAVTLSGPTDTTLTCGWTNDVVAHLTGGEVVEVWLHALTADTWRQAGQVLPTGPSTTQSLLLTGLVPGTHYKAQVRYRRGPYYRADYTGVPGTWPSGSLSGTEAPLIAAPVLAVPVWSRLSPSLEQIALAWTGSALVSSLVYRDGVLIATLPAGVFGYADQTIAGETSYVYTVTQKGDDESAPSAQTVWSGPLPADSVVGESCDIGEGPGPGYWYLNFHVPAAFVGPGTAAFYESLTPGGENYGAAPTGSRVVVAGANYSIAGAIFGDSYCPDPTHVYGTLVLTDANGDVSAPSAEGDVFTVTCP